jgi:hypothetical protein
MRQLIPRLPAATVVSLALFGSMGALTGCTYVEAMMQRQAPPDTRVQLGWQDRVLVYARDVNEYTCRGEYMMLCDRGGAITFSCTCVLR